MSIALPIPKGAFWIDIAGKQLQLTEKALLKHPFVGGVVLFTRNFESIIQLKSLISAIRDCRPDIQIGVDHEGGRVWRFEQGFSKLPSMRALGQAYDANPTETLQAVRNWGLTLSHELRAVGIDLSFAPVLDIDWGLSQVIGDRAFHANPDKVTVLASAFLAGMKEGGMLGIGKHFPGHGGCAPDSHVDAVSDERVFETLWAHDTKPFRDLAQHLQGVMVAHIAYPACDASIATFSPFWLKTVLRDKIGFKGHIYSDCLSMKGAKSQYHCLEDQIQAALQAGCDKLLICQQEAADLKETFARLT